MVTPPAFFETASCRAENLMIREDYRIVPCVGCGFCCIQEPCTYGRYAHREEIEAGRICPSLIWTGSRYICGLVSRKDSSGLFYHRELKVGEGCRSYNNPWRLHVRPRKSKTDY